ncbi:Glucokinase [Capillimicrobium parvum]|uniref:Glucokinase n=1 Tax=Capillimicrobium parvum TaxID=2884022 RepID=A0A9E7BZK2_9ACTN|nr:Glucokinase [Capillimicrobium parvum]
MVAKVPKRCVIGVDLGGTKLLAGAVDGELRVHHRALRSSRGNVTREVLSIIEGAVREAIEAVGGAAEGVGLGIPSTIDRRRGVSVYATHLPLAGVPVADLLAERLDLPVFMDNDANLAMLVEHRAGAARGVDHALMLTLGTGIGGGILVDGRVYRGSQGAAGELGHIVVDQDGPPCQGNCPNRGCLEVMASGSALVREATAMAGERPRSELGRALASGRGITGPLVTELAHDGDEAARDVLALIGRRLGVGLSSLVNVFNPDVVVIGGGVVAAGELLLEPARDELLTRGLPPARDHVRVVPARFGEESGMLGAALLARDGVDARAAA